jgi:hypothetical protein
VTLEITDSDSVAEDYAEPEVVERQPMPLMAK